MQTTNIQESGSMKCKYCDSETKGNLYLCEFHCKEKWKYMQGSEPKRYYGQVV